MPKLFPFRGLRPDQKYVEQVSAKSTDFSSKEDLVNEIQNNPFTFHHLTKGHLRYSGSYQSPEKFLPFALQYIRKMKADGILLQELEESFYVYEQVDQNGISYKGIIALCSVDDYNNNKIKKHEEIRPSRLHYLVELFKTAKVLGEPTLLAYKGNIAIDSYKTKPVFSFQSPDGKKHIVSKVTLSEEMDRLNHEFELIDDFYIADGHHRSASVSKFNEVSHHYFNDKMMCFVIQEDQLSILPFHRLVNSIHLNDKVSILSKLSEEFDVKKSTESIYIVNNEGTFGIYLDKEWYEISFRGDRAGRLDVEIIEQHIIYNVFGISNSSTDSQIAFHPHTQGENEMCKLIDSGIYTIGITNKSCSFEEVRKVSDQNKTLPPKSTYIEPKLRSGMIIQEF
jgi:uncharacterized protein (DUF1015 family)